jgi:hypothetical protein
VNFILKGVALAIDELSQGAAQAKIAAQDQPKVSIASNRMTGPNCALTARA